MRLQRLKPALVALICLLFATQVQADTQEQIDAGVKRALAWLEADRNTAKLLDKASAVLIFPDIIEMGFGVGGEFGEGALVVDGDTEGYYLTAGKVYGLDSDEVYKAEVIFFMGDAALQEMRKRPSWRPVEHSRARVVENPGEIRDALRAKSSIVGLTFVEKGLVGGLGMAGDRISPLAR